MLLLLIFYVLFLLGLAGFAGSALYHAYRFGYVGDRTRFAAGVYLAFIIGILTGSFVMIAMTDWSGGLFT